MSARAITLRVLLVALAVAAAMAVLMVLAPGMSSGKALGGSMVLAFAAALTLPGMPGTSGQPFRVVGATWCCYLAIATAGLEAAIWGPSFIGERVVSAVLILGGSLLVVAPALRRLDSPDTSMRRSEWTLIGGVSVATLLGVIGAAAQPTPLAERLILEWGLMLGFSLLASAGVVGYAAGLPTAARWLGHFTLASALAALVLSTANNLAHHGGDWPRDDWTRGALLACGLATAGGVWLLISAARLERPAQWLRAVAVGATLAATISWVFALESGSSHWLERTAAAATIVDGCALMAAVVLFIIGHTERHREAGAIRAARLYCPRCEKSFVAELGESPCPRCGLLAIVGFRETACPQCNYDLRSTPPGTPCPECGRQSQPQTAVAVAAVVAAPTA